MSKRCRYEVQTRFYVPGLPEWENRWHETTAPDETGACEQTDKLLTFPTRQAAQDELADHYAHMDAAGITFSMDEYRIVKL